MSKYCCLLGVVYISGLYAQDVRPPIDTDRPDFTESTAVVGVEILQTEGGVLLSVMRQNGSRVVTHSVPNQLVRIGIGDRFELRF